MIGNFADVAFIGFDSGVNLFLWATTDDTRATFTVNGVCLPSFGIEVTDMDALVQKVTESGVELHDGGQVGVDSEGRQFFKFFDPFGNMIVAHQEP